MSIPEQYILWPQSTYTRLLWGQSIYYLGRWTLREARLRRCKGVEFMHTRALLELPCARLLMGAECTVRDALPTPTGNVRLQGQAVCVVSLFF